MRMMAVDTFFKTPTNVRLNDDYDTPGRTRRRSIKMLTFEEADDMFGITGNEELDLRNYIKKPFNVWR